MISMCCIKTKCNKRDWKNLYLVIHKRLNQFYCLKRTQQSWLVPDNFITAYCKGIRSWININFSEQLLHHTKFSHQCDKFLSHIEDKPMKFSQDRCVSLHKKLFSCNFKVFHSSYIKLLKMHYYSFAMPHVPGRNK